MKLVIALYIAPIPFEIAFGVVKRESYDFSRLAILVLAVTTLVGILTLLVAGAVGISRSSWVSTSSSSAWPWPRSAS